MKKISTIALYSFLVLMLVFGLVAVPARAADHLDGPMAKHDGRLDITDVYAFQSPSNPANTVLIMNVDPVAGVLSPNTFRSDALYGDLRADWRRRCAALHEAAVVLSAGRRSGDHHHVDFRAGQIVV